jgi:hypothetical protein
MRRKHGPFSRHDRAAFPAPTHSPVRGRIGGLVRCLVVPGSPGEDVVACSVLRVRTPRTGGTFRQTRMTVAGLLVVFVVLCAVIPLLGVLAGRP